MFKILAAPAKAMFVLCINQYGLGFLILLAALFLLALSLFRQLRSRLDAPGDKYMSYIKLQLRLPLILEALVVISYLCLLAIEPGVAGHIFAGLGILFLPGLAIYSGCQLGGLLGLWTHYKDTDPSKVEDKDEENKDNNRKD